MAIAGEPGMVGEGAAPTAASAGETQGATPFATIRGGIDNFRERLQVARFRYIAMAVTGALLVAIIAFVWIWSQRAEYRVLFTNYSDKDGGSIVATLEQMNVPYKFTQGGGAILVPEKMVHDLRLRLAAQGLPKTGGVGFELMENQKIGTSQFVEQVNFQRALEGELGRTIQSMDAIQSARIHLAMSKSSVFVRDRLKQTASVMLTLFHGRSLSKMQVNAIVHLVASSVPGLSAADVTVVDQDGELLSWLDREKGDNGTEKMDAKQMQYVQELQKNMVKRIEALLAPVVGEKNVRAEAAVELDFGHAEQADEVYKPNQAPNTPSIRSQQNTESSKMVAKPDGGIPGAVTNQPPVPPTAPLVQPGAPGGGYAPPGQRVFTPVGQAGNNVPMEGKKDSVINYEVDKTIRYTRQAIGAVKRVTVGVAVNYRMQVDADGNETPVPLKDAEKEEIANLVKGAVGFSAERGDTVSVLNMQFNKPKEPPLWRHPDTIGVVKEIARDYSKYIIIGLICLYLYFAFARKLIYRWSGREERDRQEKAAREAAAQAKQEPTLGRQTVGAGAVMADGEDAVVSLSGRAPLEEPKEEEPYARVLEMAKEMARNNPKAVANVLIEWIGA
ncbi:MAG: flagellar M-ring protein FliF [Burkholderiaceae bacterium]|jgi:flagellar M-ring protein FliF|nr:flagellar M-ring protein FliF [Burkholderiaceae bacterium]